MPAVSSSAMCTFCAYSPSRMLAGNTCESIEAMTAAVFGCGMTLHIVSGLPQFTRAFEQVHDVIENRVEIAHLLRDRDVLDVGIFVRRARRSCRDRPGRLFPVEACRAVRRISRSDGRADRPCRETARGTRWPCCHDIWPISARSFALNRRPSNGPREFLEMRVSSRLSAGMNLFMVGLTLVFQGRRAQSRGGAKIDPPSLDSGKLGNYSEQAVAAGLSRFRTCLGEASALTAVSETTGAARNDCDATRRRQRPFVVPSCRAGARAKGGYGRM